MEDGNRQKFPMNSEQIQKIIPHRYPFLFVDSVLEIDVVGKSIIAIKNVSISDPILQGHFPDRPIYPGVLLLEALAQTSCILGCYSLSLDTKDRKNSHYLLTQVNEARFKGQVVPGDQLQFKVVIDKAKMDFTWFSGSATVSGREVVSARLSSYFQK